MARTQHDAVWRGQQQIIDVLDAQMSSRLTTTQPAGLNVSAPASSAYYALGSERSVRGHHANGNPLVYAYPVGREERMGRTGTGTQECARLQWDVAVAVKVYTEAGAADYAATWKTLEPAEREYYRLRILIGTVCDVLDQYARNGDDVMDARFVETTTDIDLQPNQAGIWARAIYTIDQEIIVLRQNAIA